MKKATVSVKINVVDGFEIGDCAKCPIAIKEYKEHSYCNGINIFKCPLGYNSAICPMEIETANIKSEAVKEFAKELIFNLDEDIAAYANVGHGLNVYEWLYSYLRSKRAITEEDDDA